MIWLDYMLLVIVGLSAVYSVFRGFVREVLSLAGWVLSFWAAIKFSPQLAEQLVDYITLSGARFVVAFLILFLLILVSSYIVAKMLVKLVRLGGLTGLDRLVGAGFGVLRGVVIATLLVMFGGLSPLSEEPAWQQSVMVSYLNKIASWASDNIPEEIAASAQERLS